MSYEPGVAVQARDQQDRSLVLQAFDGRSALGHAAVPVSSAPEALTVPAANLELRVSALQAGLPVGRFELTARSIPSGELLLSAEVPSGVRTEVGDILVTLEPAPYAVYRVKHDPAASAILIAALALVAGTGLSLFSANGHLS
jgi:hypothetical protein